jgi:MOSC domain-containing protein YiiM
MAHANDTNTAAAKPVNNQHPHIHALFIGQPKTITDERGTWTSSIYRDPVSEPVLAQPGGLVGDKVAQPYHGGPDADICVHLLDHYRFWNAHYGMNLQAGFVGENFTLDGIHEAEICVGDLVRVGTALVQVTGPRIPCANLARRIGRADWVKLTVRENRTGCSKSALTQRGQFQPSIAVSTWTLTRPTPNKCSRCKGWPLIGRKRPPNVWPINKSIGWQR